MHVHQSEVCRRQTTVAAINSWLLQGSSKVLSVTMVPDEQLLLRLILLIRPATSSNLETEEHEQRTLTWPRNLRFDVMVITLVGKQKISSLTTTPRDCRQSSFLPSVKIFPAQSVTQNSFGPSSIFWCAESFGDLCNATRLGFSDHYLLLLSSTSCCCNRRTAESSHAAKPTLVPQNCCRPANTDANTV
ncbi:hypothetical protein B296_00059234 [Ensete ventricosum]|uniref:Uncharacterized protein n=1 Tax=Ensete ventricosum TaxID=4639 RepID=A0A426XIP7_ENSVE|nr:hypothetical protein B296_00059234 [Ensete ventricosum]